MARSFRVGMPRGRIAPLAFGMKTRRTGDGRYPVRLRPSFSNRRPVLVGGTHDSVDAGRLASAVLLGDLADGQELGGPRRRQEALQGLHPAHVPPDLGHEDAVLEAAHVPLDLTPLDLAPVGRGERPVCVGGFPRRQHAPVGRSTLRGHLTFTPSAVVEFGSASRRPGTSPVSRTLLRALAWSTIFGFTPCAGRPSARSGRSASRSGDRGMGSLSQFRGDSERRETGPARKTGGVGGHRGRPYEEAPRTRTSEDVPASTALRGYN